MRSVNRPENQLVIVKDRHESRNVRQVTAAKVGIVQQEDITLMHIVSEKLNDRFCCPG